MSRFDYSHWRRPKSACFLCRKVFKDAFDNCPHCGNKLNFMGTHFKAPKRSKDKEWEAIEILYTVGVRFDVDDVHVQSGWTRLYAIHGNLFSCSDLWQVLMENRISGTDPTKWHWDTLWQFPGQRPTDPRQARVYAETWKKNRIFRIALVYEVCGKLELRYPPIDADLVAPVLALVQKRAEKGYSQANHLNDESILRRLPTEELAPRVFFYEGE